MGWCRRSLVERLTRGVTFPPKRVKIPRGSGAQAPSPAFGRGFCTVGSFARSRGRLRSLVPKGFAEDFRQSEVEGPCAEACFLRTQAPAGVPPLHRANTARVGDPVPVPQRPGFSTKAIFSCR